MAGPNLVDRKKNLSAKNLSWPIIPKDEFLTKNSIFFLDLSYFYSRVIRGSRVILRQNPIILGKIIWTIAVQW